MSDFKGRHFGGEIVLWAVRWYCRYGISYRGLEQMTAERGVRVDHAAIYRRVQRYAPEIEKRMRWQWRRPKSTSWRVDETYAKAAKRFLGKALRGLKGWEQPRIVNTDKAPTYAAALAELGAEGKCREDLEHRQVKYLNNIVEADRGKLKQLIKPVRGFKALKSAYATIKGFEVMRALRKGRGSAFNLANDMNGEVRMIERAFGLGPCGLSEAISMLENRLAT